MWSVDDLDDVLLLDGVLLRVERHRVPRVLLLVDRLRLHLDDLAMHVKHVQILALQPDNHTDRLRTEVAGVTRGQNWGHRRLRGVNRGRKGSREGKSHRSSKGVT